MKTLLSDSPKPWKDSIKKNKNSPSSKGSPNREEKPPSNFKDFNELKLKSSGKLFNKKKKFNKKKTSPQLINTEKPSNNFLLVPTKITTEPVFTTLKSSLRSKRNRKTQFKEAKFKKTRSEKNLNKEKDRCKKMIEDPKKEEETLCSEFKGKDNTKALRKKHLSSKRGTIWRGLRRVKRTSLWEWSQQLWVKCRLEKR